MGSQLCECPDNGHCSNPEANQYVECTSRTSEPKLMRVHDHGDCIPQLTLTGPYTFAFLLVNECYGDFFANYFYKKTAARKNQGKCDKNRREDIGSSTGFHRSSMFIPRAKIALQELLEVPQMNTLKMGLGLIALLVCMSLLLMGAAQDTKDTSQITRYGVTGCLQEGHDVNKYQLIAENAKWDLKSHDVILADHVGHKV